MIGMCGIWFVCVFFFDKTYTRKFFLLLLLLKSTKSQHIGSEKQTHSPRSYIYMCSVHIKRAFNLFVAHKISRLSAICAALPFFPHPDEFSSFMLSYFLPFTFFLNISLLLLLGSGCVWAVFFRVLLG